METNNSMTAGLPQTIQPAPALEQGLVIGAAQPDVNLQFEQTEQPVVTHEENVSHQEAWEGIMTTAKDDGVDTAFERLADGEFDQENDTVGSLSIPETVDTETDQPEGAKEKKDTEKEMLKERIDELEQQVTNLKEKNVNLFERVQAIEMQRDTSNEALLTLITALYEMAQKEEDERKKVTMFELLIDALSAFMRAMVMPEEMGKQNKTTSEVRDVREVRSNPESKILLFQMLKELMQTNGNQMPNNVSQLNNIMPRKKHEEDDSSSL